MKDRVKKVRKNVGMTQQDFAKALNVSKSTIESIEYGRREMSDRTLKDICRVFHISEKWLTTGEGEMIQAPSREAEIAEMTARMFNADDVDYRYQLMRVLNQVSDEDMATLYDLAKQWVDAVLEAEASENNED